MKTFRYFRDGLFLAGCLLYGLNRWVLKPELEPGFFHAHFNDLLLIPCALPLMLLLHRKLKLRTHDGQPTPGEVALHLVVWSVLFELVGPNWMVYTTADPHDVLAYAAGAVAAGAWWNRENLQWRRLHEF